METTQVDNPPLITPTASRRLLTWIAIYKIFKAVAMLAAGIATLNLLHRDLTQLVLRLVHDLNFDPKGQVVLWTLSHVLTITPRRLRLIGAGFFTYAVMYAVEGLGLYFEKRWAEWLTALTTAILIPLEAWEFWRKPGVIKGIVVILNAALVVYLVWRLIRDQHRLELLAGAETPVRDEPPFT